MNDYQLGYRKGYHRAYSRRGAWHDHKPPMPPQPIVMEMYAAARKLRDIADDIQAQLGGEEDPIAKELCAGIDAVDEASKSLAAWLKLPDDEAAMKERTP